MTLPLSTHSFLRMLFREGLKTGFYDFQVRFPSMRPRCIYSSACAGTCAGTSLSLSRLALPYLTKHTRPFTQPPTPTPQIARDAYREWAGKTGIPMREDLVFRFIEWQTLQLAPITPHWAEHVWSELLNKEEGGGGLVIDAAWPAPAPEDKAMTQAYAFLKARAEAGA